MSSLSFTSRQKHWGEEWSTTKAFVPLQIDLNKRSPLRARISMFLSKENNCNAMVTIQYNGYNTHIRESLLTFVLSVHSNEVEKYRSVILLCFHTSQCPSNGYKFQYMPCVFFFLHRAFWYSHISFTNRCTFIKTLITIYIKIRWLLHVSVYDHHQGACNWAWLKLYWY